MAQAPLMSSIKALAFMSTLAILCMVQPTVLANNSEVDDLAMLFSSGFGLVSNKLGQKDQTEVSLGPSPVIEAEKRMNELYRNLERNLMDARQRAANSRSSLTSSKIDELKLM